MVFTMNNSRGVIYLWSVKSLTKTGSLYLKVDLFISRRYSLSEATG